MEWNKLDKSIQNSESLSNFKKSMLKFIRRSPNRTCNCSSIKGIKHLIRLSLGLSHLRNHKFKHGFLNLLNPICICGFDIETICHFLVHCLSFINERSLLLKNVSRLTKDKWPSCDSSVIKRLLYDDDSLDLVKSILILDAFVDFILSSKRFDRPPL